MWKLLALATLSTACGTRGVREPPTATPAEGLAIAIYASGERSYGVVDDRRTVEVADDTLVLDRIDPAAALQSLVIEPLGDDPIHIVSCVRERVDDSPAALSQLSEARGERPKRMIVVHDLHDPSPERFHFENTNEMEPAVVPGAGVLSPLVRCRVKARAGKHLVRVLHVTSTLRFRTQHDLTMTDAERARITTRFAIETPAWRSRANVILFEGIPGDETPPHELARGPIILDGSTAIIASGTRELPARLRRIYDGTKLEDSDDVKPNDIVWGRESRHQVWVVVDITDTLTRGAVRAHVELPDQPARDIDIAPELAHQIAEVTRLPLWIDEDLLGSRRRTIERADGVLITDRVQLSISNLGTQPREVWIEERLRTSKRRSLVQAWPTRPTFSKDFARTKLTLAPGQTERLGFTIDYEF